MKKLLLLILAVTICLALSGIGALAQHTTESTQPAPPPTPITKSPAMLDSKPELATPKPKPPMDLTAPGGSDEKVAPKEGKTKSTP